MAQFTHTEATGAANISQSYAPGYAFWFDIYHLHLNGTGDGNDLTITKKSGTAAAYDTVLLTQDMTAITDLNYQPANPIRFKAGDSLLIEWTNGSTRTYGSEISTRKSGVYE